MKKKIGGIGLCMLAWSILTCAQTITPQAEQRAREIVSKMTLQEKIEYISGFTSFSLRAIPRLGIPEIRLADGPQGIRNHAPKSTLYPSGILSASTWNRSYRTWLDSCASAHLHLHRDSGAYFRIADEKGYAFSRYARGQAEARRSFGRG